MTPAIPPELTTIMRIVSLLPSATEIVCSLGFQEQLVGVTHECDHPANVLELPKVTKTLIPHDAPSQEIDGLVRERLKSQQALYSLDMPVLQRLKPDLLVTQALCDVCAVAKEEVRDAVCSLPGNPRVVNLEPMRLAEMFDAIQLVGEAAGCAAKAVSTIAELQHRVDNVVARSKQVTEPPRVMLLEWIDPPFCAGHWSPELVRLAGGREIIGDEGRPSRKTLWSDIVAADPQVLLIACCGFSVERTLADLPILKAYPHWNSLQCAKENQVFVVDGSAYFSRPGPRLVDSLEVLAHTLHPNLHPLPSHLSPAVRIPLEDV